MGNNFSDSPVGIRAIENYRTGVTYSMAPLEEALPVGEEHREQIVQVCNQPAIYDLLFAKRLNGIAYSEADAERFVTWGQRGWREKTHFVFLILTASVPGEVVGALDIKSATKEAAEIGYWLSNAHSGVMTNAVRELVNIARSEGYLSLYALVRVTNTRSAQVLTRNGFSLTEEFIKEGNLYYRFALVL